jgi:uncharacterized protein YnzC (UPF0291/DUF896 family)
MRNSVPEISDVPLTFILMQLMIGITTINLIFLLVTVIVVKLFKFRICFSSFVASIVLTWFSMGILGLMYGKPVESPLLGGMAMFITVMVYAGFLFMMQPDTLQKLASNELRKSELLKKELEKKKLRNDINCIKKSKESSLTKKQKIEEAQLRLKEIEIERTLVKKAFKKQSLVDRLFKRKAQ